MKKKLIIFLLICLVFSSVSVLAQDVSIHLKRTNPGVPGEKAAELVFDIASINFEHRIKGYMLCATYGDAVLVLTNDVGQTYTQQDGRYLISLTKGPSLQTASIMLEAETEGDKMLDCELQYVPYKLELIEGEEVMKYRTLQEEYVDDPEGHYRMLTIDKTVRFQAFDEHSPECGDGICEYWEGCSDCPKDCSCVGDYLLMLGVLLILILLFLIFYFRRKIKKTQKISEAAKREKFLGRIKIAYRTITVLAVFLGWPVYKELGSYIIYSLTDDPIFLALMIPLLVISLIPLISFIYQFCMKGRTERFRKWYYIIFLVVNLLYLVYFFYF